MFVRLCISVDAVLHIWKSEGHLLESSLDIGAFSY